jgi:triphosphoribosyl-dephospho-CoA synthase
MSTFSFNPDEPGALNLQSLPFAEVSLETRLAALAVRALIEEADLTPKPGLVDQRGSGAHADLNLALMHRSARSLFPCFRAIAAASAGQLSSQHLREQLAAIGRDGERAMFAATGGSNSHKGAIWALGLLVAGTVLASGCSDARAIASLAGSLARHPDSQTPLVLAHGAQVRQKYGVNGASGEAQEGFPHVLCTGLPALRKARSQGVPENYARLDSLMAIMAELDDTCLLHRGGMSALQAARHGARCVLDAGGTSTTQGLNLLVQLDAELLKLNASPGGSADLLAATLFLDSIDQPWVQQSRFHHHGDAELWKN